MEKLENLTGWLKANPFLALAGALTTIVGLVASVNNAAPVIFKIIDRPECLTYSSVYIGPWSEFRKEGKKWLEYAPDSNNVIFEFREALRTRENIDLVNLTERPDEPAWRTLAVRLPVCGGEAKLSTSIPQKWVYLCDVVRR